MLSILEGFRRLSDFRGRSSPGQFWPYAMVVLIGGFALIGIAASFAISEVFAELGAFAVENPDKATITRGPGSMSIQVHDPSGMPPLRLERFFVTLAVGVVALACLLAAAVTRRLHDTGRPGWWGLPPLLFLGVGFALFPRMMTDFSAPETELEPAAFGLFALLFANNILYLASLLALFILLILKSHAGDNRYGPQP